MPGRKPVGEHRPIKTLERVLSKAGLDRMQPREPGRHAHPGHGAAEIRRGGPGARRRPGRPTAYRRASRIVVVGVSEALWAASLSTLDMGRTLAT